MIEVFTSIVLQEGNCEIKTATGWHYFRASLKAEGIPTFIMKYLILDLCSINGKKVTEKQIDNMLMSDIIKINEVISVMMNPLYEIS